MEIRDWDDELVFKIPELAFGYETIEKADGYEILRSFNSKPLSDYIHIPVEHHNLRFLPQPKQVVPKGMVGYQPDNIAGSIAVYHAWKKHNKYKTGKLFHIYAPYVIDANLQKQKCLMQISETELLLKLPKTFMTSTKYPITLDPDFGYKTIGGTLQSYGGAAAIYACKFAATGTGTVTQISYYTRSLSGTSKVKTTGYSDNAGAPNAPLGGSNELSVDTTPAWEDFTDSWACTNGVDYWLTAFSEQAYWYYDAGAANQRASHTQAYDGFPNPFGAPSYAAEEWSIYATYTAAGGGQQLFTLINMMDY